MRFILASSSPRRYEILQTLIDTFEIIKPEIDETQHDGEPPLIYVERLSRQKAQAVMQRVDHDAAVLAADTVVILAADTIGIAEDGEILGKPQDAQEARLMLRRLRSRPHLVCTAFTLLHAGAAHTETVCTTVTMRDYSDAEIDAYIATGDPFDKAGSYAIQHGEFRPVLAIAGSYTNVVGLPAEEVRTALLHLGIPVRTDSSSD